MQWLLSFSTKSQFQPRAPPNASDRTQEVFRFPPHGMPCNKLIEANTKIITTNEKSANSLICWICQCESIRLIDIWKLCTEFRQSKCDVIELGPQITCSAFIAVDYSFWYYRIYVITLESSGVRCQRHDLINHGRLWECRL